MKERLLNIELENFIYNKILTVKYNHFVYDVLEDRISVLKKSTGHIEHFCYLYKEQAEMDYKFLLKIAFEFSKK